MPPIDLSWIWINPWTLFVLVVITIVFLVFAIIWSVRAHQRKVSAGLEEMIGRIAVVEIALEPKGVVLIEGERWTALSEKGRIEVEEEVVVTRVQGLKLYVKKQSEEVNK
ncbi:NfeD family protein [Chloroflexota bacterium]